MAAPLWALHAAEADALAPDAKLGRAWRAGQHKGGAARKGQRGAFNLAIEAIAESMGTRDFDRVLAEIRKDAEGDSDLMDDLRYRPTAPVTVTFQEVDDEERKVRFLVDGSEQERAFKTVKNILAPSKT